jgi:hypothetical protein
MNSMGFFNYCANDLHVCYLMILLQCMGVFFFCNFVVCTIKYTHTCALGTGFTRVYCKGRMKLPLIPER